MRKIKVAITAIVAVIHTVLMAQSPQQMNYQAVVRNASGQPVTSGNVSMRFTIHDSTANGTVVFQEHDMATPNQFGLVTVAIGAVSNNLGTVNWGSGAKYLEVEMDITGGSNYVDMGNTQLISVPYALFAANSAQGPPGPTGPQGPTGANGLAGAQGGSGAQGPMGLTGVTGAQGPTGLAGLTGATGPSGANGATGAQGPTGTAGLAGLTGASGITGATGPVGCTTPNQVLKSNGTTAVCSEIYDDGVHVGIGTDTPTAKLDINGSLRVRNGNPVYKSVLTSTDTLGNATWTIPPSIDTLSDGTSQLVASGTASALYTPPVTLTQGVYFVTPYNCISGSSADYYVQFTAVAISGTISSGFTNRDFSQLNAFSITPFILKVKSPTAIVEFEINQGGGGTITNPPTVSNCSTFEYMKIGY